MAVHSADDVQYGATQNLNYKNVFSVFGTL